MIIHLPHNKNTHHQMEYNIHNDKMPFGRKKQINLFGSI